MQLDHGAILRKETGHETPKMIRWIVAKPEVIQTGSGRLVPGSRHVGSDRDCSRLTGYSETDPLPKSALRALSLARSTFFLELAPHK